MNRIDKSPDTFNKLSSCCYGGSCSCSCCSGGDMGRKVIIALMMERAQEVG